jgi:hypothetical protein
MDVSSLLARRRACWSTSRSSRAAASALAAVRMVERETTSPRRVSADEALVMDWVPDDARRLSSEVAGSAARTPMVTADSVATTASGADTRTERGIRDCWG